MQKPREQAQVARLEQRYDRRQIAALAHQGGEPRRKVSQGLVRKTRLSGPSPRVQDRNFVQSQWCAEKTPSHLVHYSRPRWLLCAAACHKHCWLYYYLNIIESE